MTRFLNTEGCERCKMEQNVTETNLLHQNEQAKKEQSWLMAQSADENQEQQTQNASIFYKFDSSIGKP